MALKKNAVAVWRMALNFVLLPQNSKRMKKSILIITCIAASIILFSSCTRTEKNYYPDGRLQSIIHYRFGKETGKSVYMFQRPNTVEIEVEMKKGKRNGKFYRYFENGNLDTYCIYVNDSIEGIETMYTPNGEKIQETTYTHGRKNGPHREYHVNGQIKAEGNFKNNLFDGDWIYYDERGVVVGEGTFKDGTGTLTAYNTVGKIAMSTQYEHNKKNGKETYYTSGGNIYKEIIYKQDRIVSQRVDSTLIP